MATKPKETPPSAEVAAVDPERETDVKLAQFLRGGFDMGTARVIDIGEITGRLPKLTKDSLIGTPFIVTEIKRITESKYGQDYYYFCAVKTIDGREGFFVDGGVGVIEAIDLFIDQTGQWAGLFARQGLHRSDYQTEEGIEASTYYFA